MTINPFLRHEALGPATPTIPPGTTVILKPDEAYRDSGAPIVGRPAVAIATNRQNAG